MKSIWILPFFVFLTSCGSGTVNAEFVEIDDNMARFDIINNSDNDIAKITYQVKFFDSSEDLILADTTTYEMDAESSKKNLPFLKANDKTFVVNKTPENCVKAEIKLIEIGYMN